MSNFLRAVVITMSLCVAGCAIHPLPEDVTGVSTNDIVRKIRCEARDAVRAKIVAWLLTRTNDPAAQRIGADLASGAMSLDSFTTKPLAPRTRIYVDYFAQSEIAYNFTFDMTELNNLGVTVNLIKPLTGGTFTAALGGGIDRTRQNIRTFTVSDSFHRLVYELRDTYCDGLAHGPKYVYPITGKIGIAEMIDTFVDLALFGGLAGKGGEGAAPKGPLAMGDTIVFTTKLSGSATPKIVLTPVGNALQLADASLAAAVSRTDVHKVIVGMSVPGPFESFRGPSVARAVPRSLFTQVARPVGQTAHERALEMIATQIFRFEHPLGTSAVVVSP